MADANNKVKYGLKNVYYAPLTIGEDGAPSFGKPEAWPGAVNLSMAAQGEATKFRADNIDYFICQNNSGYSGSLESAIVPEKFKKDILGYIVSKSGTLVEDANAKTKPFALLFQFEGDVKATRHIFYNTVASRPDVNGKTTDKTITPETEVCNIETGTVYDASLDTDIVKGSCHKGDTDYDTWFTTVTLPEKAQV